MPSAPEAPGLQRGRRASRRRWLAALAVAPLTAAVGLACSRAVSTGAPQLAFLDHVSRQNTLQTPDQLKSRLPVPQTLQRFVNASRAQVAAILRGDDDRLMAVVGPCSVHDLSAVNDYARRLRRVAQLLQDDLFIVMRTYLEKPRTAVGWRGIVSDPDLSGEENMEKGVEVGRRALLDVNSAGLPAAVEFLDPLAAPYFEDLVSYGTLGARTVESPTHRALAAALAMPMGFKNSPSGDVQSAVNGVIAASSPQRRATTDGSGRIQVLEAPGNADGHVVLRGGAAGPNFDQESVQDAAARLNKAGLGHKRIMVDCSHANSGKRHEGQIDSCRAVASQVAEGSTSIAGVMIESFLQAGNQPLNPGVTKVGDLQYGLSVTDACLDFSSTHDLLVELAQAARSRRETAAAA